MDLGSSSSSPTDILSSHETFERYKTQFLVRYQTFIDRITPHTYPRWGAAFILILIYAIRVHRLEGFYIISYGLAIYVLNLFIGFLTPNIDPETAQHEPSLLPTGQDDEFRPFVRKLPEMKFWVQFTRAVLLGLFATFFAFLDIPVFWPATRVEDHGRE